MSHVVMSGKGNHFSSGSILDRLDSNFRQDLFMECSVREYLKNDQILYASDNNCNVYVVNSGVVRVTLYSENGKEVSFTDLYAGEHFGELSAIDGMDRSANINALTDVSITVIPQSTFINMIEKSPEFSLAVMSNLTKMVRRLHNRVFEYTVLGVKERIHSEILRMSENCLDLDGVARVHKFPKHAELASRVSCTREAVTRELNDLEKSGLIERKNRKLVVNNINRLRDLVQNDQAAA